MITTMKTMRRHVMAAQAILLMVCLDASVRRAKRGQILPGTEVLRLTVS